MLCLGFELRRVAERMAQNESTGTMGAWLIYLNIILCNFSMPLCALYTTHSMNEAIVAI